MIVAVGCYTPKKADKHLTKAMDKFPEKVAKVCTKEYPCKPGKTDTIEKVYYDLIEVECPDMTSVKYDTIEKEVIKTITKTIKVPVKVPAKEIVITKYIIDSAYNKVIQSELEKCKLEKEVNKDRSKSRMTIIWALVALVCLLITYIAIRKK